MPVSEDAVASGLARVGAAELELLPRLTHEIRVLIMESIPELRGDDLVEKLLDASVEENIATLMHDGMTALTSNGILGDARPATVPHGITYRDLMADALADWIRERYPA